MKQEGKKNNSYLCTKEFVDKKGKVHNNLILTTKLNNGIVVTFEISQKFYNAKFNYLLVNNLPKGEK